MPDPFRILAMPFQEGEKGNPYITSLYAGVQKKGIEVVSFSITNALRQKYALWHIHWPDLIINKPLISASIKLFGFLFLLGWLKLRGTKILWTVHNLESHESRHPRLEKILWRAFIPRLDGFINLSAAGRQLALQKYPQLAGKKSYTIHHGHYQGSYPNTLTRSECRKMLGVEDAQKVLLFFGAIRPYKNVPGLIHEFLKRRDPNQKLIIAGKPFNIAIENQIQAAALKDPAIHLDLGFIAADKVQVYFNAADLVLLPFQDILNSGSALLSLSFHRPILVPDLGGMIELQQALGPDWVHLFSAPLSAESIENALNSLPAAHSQPDLREFEWPAIVDQTVDAYRDLVG